jgi:hypothetical protein
MFNSRLIEKYQQVAKEVHQKKRTEFTARQQIKLSGGRPLKASPEELMLHLLKRYHGKLGNKSHKKLTKSLIGKLELKSIGNDSRLDDVFKNISEYLYSTDKHKPLSVKGDFFSLLLVFFRHHVELIHKIRPDTQGIYAFLLLGIFSTDGHNTLINLSDIRTMRTAGNAIWTKYFLKEIIPYLSKTLLNNLMDSCIDNWGVFAKPIKEQESLLSLLCDNNSFPDDFNQNILLHSNMAVFTFKENEKRIAIFNAISLPTVIISLIANYFVPYYLEKYTYNEPSYEEKKENSSSTLNILSTLEKTSGEGMSVGSMPLAPIPLQAPSSISIKTRPQEKNLRNRFLASLDQPSTQENEASESVQFFPI